jgi:hypothetical protein
MLNLRSPAPKAANPSGAASAVLALAAYGDDATGPNQSAPAAHQSAA